MNTRRQSGSETVCSHGATDARLRVSSLVMRLVRLISVAAGGTASIRALMIMMTASVIMMIMMTTSIRVLILMMRPRTSNGWGRKTRRGRGSRRINWLRMCRLGLLGVVAVVVLGFVVKYSNDSRFVIDITQHKSY